MPGLIEQMFRRAEARQGGFLESLPEKAKQKLEEVEDKYARLWCTGPEGGVLYFQFKGQRFKVLDGPPDIPYENLDKFLIDGDLINYKSGDEVLFAVVDGDLSPRAALARKYFRANTNKIIYDSEELAQIFERLLINLQNILGVHRRQ